MTPRPRPRWQLPALLPIFSILALGAGCSSLGARQLGAAPSSSPYGGAAPAAEAGGAAGESAASLADAPAERPGLGTRFGEERSSPVHDVAFERQGGATFVGTIHYDDRDGVAALRARAGRLAPVAAGEPWLRGPGGLFSGVVVQVVDESGRPLPAYHVGGRVLVEGESGRRYALRVENHTGGRYELVASVDGLDVVDGRGASLDKRGYVVPPHGRVEIEGFRRSLREVAAFRFGSVRDSYAARSAESGDRNVGVIGLALFPERGADWAALDREAERREQAEPFPGDSGDDRFAPPPR